MTRTAETLMDRVNEGEYRTKDSALSMKREYGTTPNGNPMSGRWVLRDTGDVMLDFEKYSNDLAERHALKLF